MSKGWNGIFDFLIESSGDCDSSTGPSFPPAPSLWDEIEKKEYLAFQDAVFAAFTDLSKMGTAFEIALENLCRRPSKHPTPVAIVWLQLSTFRFCVENLLSPASLESILDLMIQMTEQDVKVNLKWIKEGGSVPAGYKKGWFCSQRILVRK